MMTQVFDDMMPWSGSIINAKIKHGEWFAIYVKTERNTISCGKIKQDLDFWHSQA